MQVTAANGLINYQEITLNNNELFNTVIQNEVSDIALNILSDELYVQVSGELTSGDRISYFNLTSGQSNYLTVSQPANYYYKDFSPTSMAIDDDSGILFISYASAVSKIDLTTNEESLLSDNSKGTGNFPQFIYDLAYNKENNKLYSTDIEAQSINTIDSETGNRKDIIVNLDRGSSLASSSKTGHLYYSQGTTTSVQTLVKELDANTNTSSIIYNIPAGSFGGPISDIAIDESNNDLFFVDGAGNLIKLDLSNNSLTEVLTEYFSVENIVNEDTPRVGLQFHKERKILLGAGKDVDGKNQILAIDPISGDYTRIASSE